MRKTAALQQREIPAPAKSSLLPTEQVVPLWRLPLMVAAVVVLLAATWGGLVRMGWGLPILQPVLVGVHGPLMVAGFFGTLISLERAVALGSRWTYLSPILSAAGGLLLIAGVQGPVPALLLTAGSLGLVAIFGEILRRHTARYTLVMAAGAAALAAGNILWLSGWPVSRIVLWWAAFLVLTISGERLELGRLARHTRVVDNLFNAVSGLFLAGLLLSLFMPGAGLKLASLGLLGLALWLLRFDIARKTIRKPGLPRFAAVCLLSGYVWLAAAGMLGLYFGAVSAGFAYDAFLHAIFLGFVFAMIFAHAPIIFPAILGLPVKFRIFNYLPLLLLHLSLLLRMAGNLSYQPQLRMWGGMLNGVTILVFLLLTVWSILSGTRESQAKPRTIDELPG